MRTGDTPEARILCTRFFQAMKGWFLSSYLLGVGWVGFVRCADTFMKKEYDAI